MYMKWPGDCLESVSIGTQNILEKIVSQKCPVRWIIGRFRDKIEAF